MWRRMKGEKKRITGINSEVAWIKWKKVSVIFTTYYKKIMIFTVGSM